jgi:hypothetical protein
MPLSRHIGQDVFREIVRMSHEMEVADRIQSGIRSMIHNLDYSPYLSSCTFRSLSISLFRYEMIPVNQYYVEVFLYCNRYDPHLISMKLRQVDPMGWWCATEQEWNILKEGLPSEAELKKSVVRCVMDYLLDESRYPAIPTSLRKELLNKK